MADVRRALDGESAQVYADLPGSPGVKVANGSGAGVVQSQAHPTSLTFEPSGSAGHGGCPCRIGGTRPAPPCSGRARGRPVLKMVWTTTILSSLIGFI